MSTILEIWTANKDRRLNSISDTAAGGIDGGYKWQRAPNGDNIQLEFSGRNDRVQVPPRGVVQLIVDGNEAFFGVLPDPPSPHLQDAAAMQVLGGQEALRVTLMDGAVYRDQGVFEIVRDILQRRCPPCLSYSAGMIGDGSGTDPGPGLSTYYAPTSTLKEALDGLAKSAAVTWGVDAGGRVFFGRPDPEQLTIPYAGHGWRDLPVQGREAVTRAVLRVLTAPALPDGAGASWDYGQGLPQTVTSEAQSAEHPTYRASRAFGAPEGVALIAPSVPAEVLPESDFDGAPVLDDAPLTGVQMQIGVAQKTLLVRSVPGRVVGVEFDYTLPLDETMPANAYQWSISLGAGLAQAQGFLLVSEENRTLRVLLPPASRAPAAWAAVFSIGTAVASEGAYTCLLTVTRIRFLVVDEAAAQRVAASYLQPPFARPAEITLRELVPPTPDVTVTGSPGGDVSGPTTLWEYQHDDQDVRTTRIRIGATGADPTVRALKFAVRQ